jgi:hypothetical protein
MILLRIVSSMILISVSLVGDGLAGELTCVLRAAEANCVKVERRVMMIRTLPVCDAADEHVNEYP